MGTGGEGEGTAGGVWGAALEERIKLKRRGRRASAAGGSREGEDEDEDEAEGVSRDGGGAVPGGAALLGQRQRAGPRHGLRGQQSRRDRAPLLRELDAGDRVHLADQHRLRGPAAGGRQRRGRRPGAGRPAPR